MARSIFILLLLGCTVGFSQSANILFYFGIASYSHKIAVWPLVEELAAKGHSITFLSPYPHKTPNPKVKELNPKALIKMFEQDQESLIEKRASGTSETDWHDLPMFGLAVCDVMFKDQEIKEWLNNPATKYDLVIIDSLFNECGLGMAYKFNAKTIIFSTFSVGIWFPDMYGHAPETSAIPDMHRHFETPMTFLERMFTTLHPIYWHLWVKGRNYLPAMDEMLRKELNLPNMPPVHELESNTSLVFLSCHHTSEYARSLPPLYVPVGGMHIVETKKPLPKDIAKFMDESGPDGVVYVSFGTYAKASLLPAETLRVFYEVFGSFKTTRFIWKFDMDRPKDMPDNILTVTWAPQQEILAHNKIRGFISHGGLLSITEATYFGVPMVVFPLFAEQDYNANVIEQSGRGVKMEIIGITKGALQDALTKILTTDKYRRRVKEVSNEFKDRQATPLATALWWTEYVLRHKDTNSLKPLSRHQTWYQRRLLDVWLFVFSVITIFLSLIVYILSKCLCGKKSTDRKDRKVKRS